MLAPVAEVDRGFPRLDHEIGQVVPSTEPGQNAISVPAPGDDLFTGDVGVEMPAVFQGIFFDAAVDPVVVPAQGQQYTSGALHASMMPCPAAGFNPTRRTTAQFSSFFAQRMNFWDQAGRIYWGANVRLRRQARRVEVWRDAPEGERLFGRCAIGARYEGPGGCAAFC